MAMMFQELQAADRWTRSSQRIDAISSALATLAAQPHPTASTGPGLVAFSAPGLQALPFGVPGSTMPVIPTATPPLAIPPGA